MKGIFIAFIVLQIVVDLAHSVTIFPFVHYGMFSAPALLPDSLAVYRVTVNGKPLVQTDYRIYRWDMITGPLIAFDQLENTHDFAFDRKKLKEYLEQTGCGGLYRWAEPDLTNSSDIGRLFPRWYRQHLSRLLGYPVDSLRVDRCWYDPHGDDFQLLRKETYINL
ncbi:MAG TPA: hypothetical protein VHE34_14565 [Puia sp.]|uniref:hypothetical protein n=1 Tax=Puia sp. TaxID=2045100 RepID=UPI002C7A720E|nr:hypothetical protein [Puia sp.]HVU96448.1 hypothetical protein [Puia sp.]